MNVPDNTPLICKNCGHTFTGKYCSNCGEKVYTRHDNTIINLVEESVHFISHLDGSFFNTLKALIVPGKLSTDYCNGIRKKYFKPISFFLLLIVLYLLFPLTEGLNQRLSYHINNPFYGNYAAKRLADVLHHKGLTMQQASEVFHQKGEKVSKFLLLIFIPVSAIILQVFTFKKHRLFFDQIIFATEINIVFIVVAFFLFPIVIQVIDYIIYLFTGKDIVVLDVVMGFLLPPVMLIYLSLAARRFYGLNSLQSVLLSIAFICFYALFFQFIYKLILFVFVIWQVH